MKYITLLSLAFVIANPVFAESETYIIDGNHTFPRFSYNHLGFSTQLSRFDKTTGDIVLDRQAKTAAIQVEIATNSVDTGSATFNQHIQGEDFLSTDKYPTATFISNKVNFDGDKIASVEGNLTLKGITKPVTLQLSSFQCILHPILLKQACGANATTTVKRSDFNMSKYAPLVGDEVTISIAVEATKQ